MTIRIESVQCWRGTMEKPNYYDAEIAIQIGEEKHQYTLVSQVTRDIAQNISKQTEEQIVNKIKEVIADCTKNLWPTKE